MNIHLRLCSFFLIITVGVILLLPSCKTSDACEKPNKLTMKWDLDLDKKYSPKESVIIALDHDPGFNTRSDPMLYCFSTPSEFENPKGEGRVVDIVEDPIYEYILKDTINYPSAITVEAYAINSCGKSEKIYMTIKYK